MSYPLEWRCHICGRIRPDEKISVYSRDLSAEMGWPPGTWTENVRYCNDALECIDAAPFYRFLLLGKKESP